MVFRILGAIALLSLSLGLSVPGGSSVVSLRVDTTASVLPVGSIAALNVIPENAQGKPVPSTFPLIDWTVAPTKGARVVPTAGAYTQLRANRPGIYTVTASLGKVKKAITERVVAAKTVPAEDRTTLTLAAPPLTDKPLDNLVGVDNVPAGMPPETAVRHVTVPLYPGMRRIPITIDNYPAPIPASWYLLASPVRGYYVKAAETAVDAWYLNAFTAAGYLMDGEGGGPTGIYTYNFTKQFRSANPLVVGVRTRPQGKGTVVVYGATVLAVPARPASTLYPKSVSGLVLRYRPTPKKAAVTRKIHQPSVVHTLVQLLNAMPLAPGGTYFGCPPEDNQAIVKISAVGPGAPYPKASLNDENLCLTQTIGSVQVVSTPAFWKLVNRMMTRATSR